MSATWQILVGDVRERLASLPAESVQTCVTSPPYWGLRDYGTATWNGGDPACDHGAERLARRQAGRQTDIEGGVPGSLRDKPRTQCACGARRIDNQLGLEPTPDAYVANMVQVFREVRRVLREDGTLWLNLGDSYASAPGKNNGNLAEYAKTQRGGGHRAGDLETPSRGVPPGMKPKDLVGIPWRVAFALQTDGWYLRSDIIWHKPNPMPESVTDRPTKSHEYLFLLTKSARYYYDAMAVAEAGTGRTDTWPGSQGRIGEQGFAAREVAPQMFRNRRSVWTIPTQPYPEAHFATYPEALVEPCILAGSREGDTVLDPFCGSGTTGAVAARLLRSFIGCELNPAYVDLARRRIGNSNPLFAQEVA